MPMRFFATIILTLSFLSSFGQLYFTRHDSVVVTEENGALDFPWAGGLNHPQFSNIDFNFDGNNDLLLFDKSGDKTICLTSDANGQLSIAPEYRAMFTNQHAPTRGRLHDWILLRDFNADGRADIFTYSNGGMAVYRNDGNQDTLIFTLMTGKLLSDYGQGLINIYVSPTDLPAIMDVDGDSDMDIVTFSLFGTAAEYHQNQSMELYGIPDSLEMILADPCWGNFEEDPATVQVNLNVTCKGGNAGITEGEQSANSGAHSGFTMLGLDIEGDGDQDLAVSIVSFNTMNILINDGDANSAHIGSQDPTFPANFNSTDPIDIYTFPAAFLADVNNDGKNDIVASPYQENNGHDYESSYLYLNNSSTAFDLGFEKNNFLQDEMIELGTAAYPVLFDYDSDGLKDLLVGNRGYFVSTGVYSSQLAYYRNTGTAEDPAFTLQTRDVANISSLSLGNVAPTFGDLDNDGDLDFVGSNNTVFWLECPEDPFDGGEWTYRTVDDEILGTHCLITGDVNQDGKIDLVANSYQIAERTQIPESILWYETPGSRAADAEWKRHTFADRDAPGGSHYMGIGDVDGDGRPDIAAGAKGGPGFDGGEWFALWTQPTDPTVPWKKQVLAEGQPGASNIHIGDLNGDGVADLLASRGHGVGLIWFKGPDFELIEIDPKIVGPHSLILEDLDGDGDLDAATCGHYETGVVAWYENDGRANFTKHVIDVNQGSYDMRAEDMDGDGDLDFIIAGHWSGNVVWYERK